MARRSLYNFIDEGGERAEMSKAASVRGSGRTAGESDSDADHELREGMIPDYIDELRSPLNSTIIETKRGPELTAICEERRGLRETKRKMKSNACVAQSILISFGKKIQPGFAALPIKTQDALYLQLMEKIAKEANTDVSGLVAHRDETAPHAHGQLVGYNREGTPLTKVMTRQFRRDMQDWMVEIFQPHLPEIERGVRKSVRLAQGDDASKTIHRSVQELHGSLGPEIDAKKAELVALIEKARKNEGRAKKARAKAEADEARSAKALKNAATYERRASSARDEISQIEAELLRLRKLQESVKAQNQELAEQGESLKATALAEGAALKVRETENLRINEELAQKKTTVQKLTEKRNSLSARLQTLRAA